MPKKVRYGATLQLRTSLDQAGQIAGIAGELEVSESEVLRILLTRALEAGDVLNYVRAHIAREEYARRRPSEDEIARSKEASGTGFTFGRDFGE